MAASSRAHCTPNDSPSRSPRPELRTASRSSTQVFRSDRPRKDGAPCPMRILITNDDGIYSPGILALAKVAAGFGHVRIVAPDVEQSSMSAAITSTRPLSYRRTVIGEFDSYRVNGTPSDCVALGTHLWERADIVLSESTSGRMWATASGTRGRSQPLARACCLAVAALPSVHRLQTSSPISMHWSRSSRVRSS